MIKKLNLGSGEFKKQGYLNADINPLTKPDFLIDLNDLRQYKLFKDNDFDEIWCEHLLEHLDKPFLIMKELHRMLKPGGRLIIRVPHFSRGFSHSEHAHGFDVGFPFYFNPTFTTSGYFGIPFELKNMKMRWMIRFDLKEKVVPGWTIVPLKIMNVSVSLLANLNPYFCSRFWCYLVGGFEEIEFVFVKPLSHSRIMANIIS